MGVSEKTLKKLFALTGNRCACPKCDQKLVDEGTLVGEVCHIEGEKPKSPRHNPEQSEDARNGFDNLIVLCNIHHKVIDDTDNRSKYPVEKLKEIKKLHEEQFKDGNFEVSDEIIKQAQIKIEQYINNYGTATAIVQSGHDTIVNITNGLSRAEVEQILKGYYPIIQQIVSEETKRRFDSFMEIFFKYASGRLTREDLEKFSNPDVQYILAESVKTIVRWDNQELREHLSNLIIKRIKSEDELQKIVLDEAILTIGKLTSKQIDILTSCFILKHATNPSVNNIDSFNEFIKVSVVPLINFSITKADIQHLEYTRCVIENTVDDLIISLKSRYYNIFSQPIPNEELNSLQIDNNLKEQFFFQDANGEYYFKAYYLPRLSLALQRELGGRTALFHSIIVLYNKYNMHEEQIISIINQSEAGQLLLTKCYNTRFDQLELTTVGIVIAILRLEQINKSPIDLNIWIK